MNYRELFLIEMQYPSCRKVGDSDENIAAVNRTVVVPFSIQLFPKMFDTLPSAT